MQKSHAALFLCATALCAACVSDAPAKSATTAEPIPTNGVYPKAPALGLRIGTLPHGRYDAITDVAGVMVGQVTHISGSGKLVTGVGPVRTGVTGVIPRADIWHHRVFAEVGPLQ